MAWLHDGQSRHCAAHERTLIPARSGRRARFSPVLVQLAAIRSIGWWQRQGWIDGDPTIGIERRPAPPDRTKALAENQIAALWRLDVALWEKTFWKMLYESAARADELVV
jgi:integrase